MSVKFFHYFHLNNELLWGAHWFKWTNLCRAAQQSTQRYVQDRNKTYVIRKKRWPTHVGKDPPAVLVECTPKLSVSPGSHTFAKPTEARDRGFCQPAPVCDPEHKKIRRFLGPSRTAIDLSLLNAAISVKGLITSVRHVRHLHITDQRQSRSLVRNRNAGEQNSRKCTLAKKQRRIFKVKTYTKKKQSKQTHLKITAFFLETGDLLTGVPNSKNFWMT